MKRLYLLRHAKSDYPEGVEDHERPLNARGRKAVLQLVDYAREHIPCPDVILCSTATRTQQTAESIQSAWEGKGNIRYLRELYLASSGEILKIIAKVEESASSVLVIGHNPGIESLAAMLPSDGNKEAYLRIRRKYPTAGLAIFSTDVPWVTLGPASATLVDFITPDKD